MCNWHLLLCGIPVNLLSTFSTGSSTKSAVPRNIFVFNRTLDAKSFKLFYTCGRAKAFAKFQLKSYEGVLEISESLFKLHTVFPLTLAVSTIYDKATITNDKTLIWWNSSFSAVLLYPFHLLWSRKTWLFGAFLYHQQLFFHAMLWRSIAQQHLSFRLTLFWRYYYYYYLFI